MLEIVQASQAPQYLQMPQGQDKAHSDQYVIKLAESHRSRTQPSGLEFRYWMQGTAVRVSVSLILDPSGSPSTPEEKHPVGDYTVHPGETVTVSHLSQYGLQPVQLEIVSAEPPGAVQPEIINEASSILVEKIEQDRAEYRLYLRNTSELGAYGIVVSVFDGNGRCMMHDFHTPSGNIILPWETGEFDLSFPVAAGDSGTVGADGRSCSYAPQSFGGPAQEAEPSGPEVPEIVIEAVDFEDGSYEGDAQKAATLEAERLGRIIGRRRITAVVESQLANAAADGMAKLVSVQSEIKNLPDNADTAAVNSIMVRFATPPGISSKSIEREIRNGLLSEKAMFLGNLRLYLFEASKGLVSNPSLQQWWDVTKGRYDFLAAPVRSDSE